MAKRIFHLIDRLALLATQQGGFASKPELVKTLAIASQQAFNALLPAKAPRAIGPGLNRALDTRLSPFLRRQQYTGGPVVLPPDCAYVDYYDVPGALAVEEVSGAALLHRLNDPIEGPTPQYVIVGAMPGQVKRLYPDVDNATIQYYAYPTEPVYKEDYDTGAPVYNDVQSVDTGWGLEMEPELLVRSLRLLGLEIRDPQLQAVAAQLTAETA